MKGKRTVDVQILPGVADGQVIQLQGQGEAGEHGAPSGDLYVRVHVTAHPRFVREGDNLVLGVELRPIDILRGTPISFPTPEGKDMTVSIPAKFNLRDRLVIPKEGMPKLGGKGRGDLFLEFSIRMPKKPNAKMDALLKEWEE
jgi:molecular chaperone DnaJ